MKFLISVNKVSYQRPSFVFEIPTVPQTHVLIQPQCQSNASHLSMELPKLGDQRLTEV